MMFRVRRRLTACVCLIWFSGVSAASAHDFWVQPERFHATANTPLAFTLQVGHGALRQRSPLPLRRITHFGALGPRGTMIDLRDSLVLGGAENDGAMRFSGPGAYVVVLQTDDAAQSHLPALRFNDYLTVEGLTPALQHRARTGRVSADGSERYSRQAKAIIEVAGAGAAAEAVITARLGLPLEIVLEQNPYAQPQPQDLPVRVYYMGRPLSGALVKLTDLANDAAPFESHLTGRDGRARFAMPHRGSWLLNVIWTRSLPATEETDFETVFSSLSFGFAER